MDKTLTIGVHGLKLYAKVGLYEEERVLKNLISIDMEVTIGKNTHDFEGRKTIDYLRLVDTIKEAATHEIKLLEGLADKIMDNVKLLHDGITGIHLKIHKLQPVMGFSAHDVFVEVRI